MGKKKRERVEHTDDWDELLPLFGWPEQERYEEIRPLVLFGDPVAERAEEVGASERTLYRKLERFEAEGVESLFATESAKHRRRLPPAIRRLIVDRKAEHPAFSLGEIARICYVAFGRRPSKHTVKRVLEESPMPLMPVRRYEPYHEMPEGRKRREALVQLHADGWTVKSIAGYMKTSETTVYRVLKRWAEEGVEGLEDRPRGRHGGVVRKVDLRAMEAVRRLQENPGLGAFRVHAALEQMGLHLSRATCGRIMATNRRVYGLEEPAGTGGGAKKAMPFASSRRHGYWSADIRYVDHGLPAGGNVYVISVLENHSRAVLASSLTRTQDLPAFLSVLHRAVERYGSPEALVTDSGSVFRANRARAVYEALGIEKEEIERGKPWQNYAETTFNIQRRMADWRFAKAESWPDLLAAHGRWVDDYNRQEHWAHLAREDGRRSPSEVLGWLTGVRYRPEDLERAFFSSRFTRTLDSSGYARFKNWRVMGHEALARREAALWLQAGSLTLEHRGQPLSRYDVEFVAGTEELRAVGSPRLFETSYDDELTQLRLFGLDALGQGGWLKALKLDGYAPRRPRGPRALQQVLFSYLEAI